MARRPAIPARLQKSVFQAYGSRCALCAAADISTLQIHHIEPWSIVQEHRFDNLMVVCANCHSRIENGAISKEDIMRKKAPDIEARPTDFGRSGNVIAFSGGTNSGIIANNLTIQTERAAKIPVQPLTGTIGAEATKRNYIKYLIDRYHKFKEGEVGKDTMRYQVIYRSIKRDFGAKWDHVPACRFDRLSEYLQDKIESTKIGRIGRSRGKPLFRYFNDYIERYGSADIG